MKSAEIRDAFLQYFNEKQHQIVPSSSLVPGNDPTLLFTNAGMVQFKDVFLGKEKRPYRRATSSQRCVRAGGKHNDLENVGYTARHHTFFEMLGNFSFGDYFKRDAIDFAWEFLTRVLGIAPEKLWVTVHLSDDEAAAIWINDIGISPDRLSRLEEDNFWQMGDTGPCGPSSEIFYDHGEHVPGGPPGSKDDDLDRYIEIWNLVFMQYERQADGELRPLPKPSVDTGMGLERMAAVMQGVHNNYDIDIFKALIDAAVTATGYEDKTNQSLRVIADHIRSCSFLISDGVLPANEGRGYVLRRIIRRAVRHGHNLGQTKPFFSTLVKALVEQMGDAYPELVANRPAIETALFAEEQQFAKTLDKGMAVLNSRLTQLQGDEIPGDIIFVLYDTYGFPVDLTNDIARERNLSLDLVGYEQLMDQQKARARASGAFSVDYSADIKLEGSTSFTGYDHLQNNAKIISLFENGNAIDQATTGTEVVLVLDRTPFYGESGGQVGDSGILETSSARVEIHDCQKSGDHHLHIGVVIDGTIKRSDTVSARVDHEVRLSTALNHSATHLLHAVLRHILGDHVVQKGSLVDSKRLRFDFSHPEPLKPEQLREIEHLVNQHIRANTAVLTEQCTMEQAKKKGAMMLFGEKYGDSVRMLAMANGFSTELCGGTHVGRTGDIGLFTITSETGVAAGIRRIEALTGKKALDAVDQFRHWVEQSASLVKAKPDRLLERLQQILDHNKHLEKELASLKSQLASSAANDWLHEAEEINGVKVLVKTLEGVDAKSLRDTIDQLKNKLGRSAILLATVSDDKVALAAGVSKDATNEIKAGDMLRYVAEQVNGKGGGRPDMAQGGGSDVKALPKAMTSVIPWAKKHLL